MATAPTIIFLSNDPSDVSGYKKAYINGRSPNASSTASTAVTDTASGVGTTVTTMTLTAGGSTAQWLTAPLEEDVTISTSLFANLWGLESNAAANAHIAFALCEYTTSLQSAFVTTSISTEIGTSSARVAWVSNETVTSTTIEAGNRLAITPGIGGVSVTVTGYTVTMSYNGDAPNAAGDTYILLNHELRAGEAQLGNGDVPGITSKGKSYFLDLAADVQGAVNEGLISSNTTAQAIIDEANGQAAVS